MTEPEPVKPAPKTLPSIFSSVASSLTRASEKVLGATAAVLLCGLMVLTFVDVMGRNLLHRPLPGTLELTEIMLSLIVFLVLPQVTLRNQHIVITFLDPYIGWRGQLAQRILNSILGFAMYLVTGWQVWAMGDRLAAHGELTPTLGWSYAPFLYVLSILSYVTAAAFVLSVASPGSDKEISLG